MAGYSHPPENKETSPEMEDDAPEDDAPHSDWEKVATIRDLFYRARTARRPLIDRWVDSYEILHNRMWAPGRATWMPSPRVAQIWPAVASIVAWECDTKPSFDVTPYADPNSTYFEQTVRLAQDLRTTLRASWQINDTDAEVQKVLWDANVYGTGILKTIWSQAAHDGYGDAIMRRVDPFCFYPDPDATNTTDAQYIIETYELGDMELESRFPGALEKCQGGSAESIDRAPTLLGTDKGTAPKANAGPISPSTSAAYGLPGQGRDFSDTDSDRHLVIECWHRCMCKEGEGDGKQQGPEGEIDDTFPHWHCTIVSGDVVLFDEPAEEVWGHGQHPFDRLVAIDTGEFWGASMVEFLTPIQKSINRLLAAIEQNIWLAGNPILMEDSRSGIQRTKVTNKPGQRLTKNAGSDVSWMDPPQIHPQLAMQLVQFYVGEIERISGLSAIVRGATPTGRNSQGVLDSVQEAAFVRIRLTLTNLESCLRSAGQKRAALIAEFYDTPRIVALVGDTGEQTLTALEGKHFYVPDFDTQGAAAPMRFRLSVQAGSSISTSRSSRIAEADTLFAMQAIDEEALLQAHDFPNWPTVTARMRELKAAQGTLGEPPGSRQAAGRTS